MEERFTRIPVQPSMRKLKLFSIIALGLISGCVHSQRAGTGGVAPIADRAVILDEAKVIEIARQAVAANDAWVEKAEFERPRRRSDGSWSVFVWRLPKVPGGHRLIVIDQNGRVTDYIRGA